MQWTTRASRRKQRQVRQMQWHITFLWLPTAVSYDTKMWLCSVARRRHRDYPNRWEYGPISNILVDHSKAEVWG